MSGATLKNGGPTDARQGKLRSWPCQLGAMPKDMMRSVALRDSASHMLGDGPLPRCRLRGLCTTEVQTADPVVLDACGLEAATLVTASPAVLNVTGMQSMSCSGEQCERRVVLTWQSPPSSQPLSWKQRILHS